MCQRINRHFFVEHKLKLRCVERNFDSHHFAHEQKEEELSIRPLGLKSDETIKNEFNFFQKEITTKSLFLAQKRIIPFILGIQINNTVLSVNKSSTRITFTQDIRKTNLPFPLHCFEIFLNTYSFFFKKHKNGAKRHILMKRKQKVSYRKTNESCLTDFLLEDVPFCHFFAFFKKLFFFFH